jgi:hypothetical protein
MPTTVPVAALTFLGVLLAVIGLFVAGNIVIVVIGLLSIFGAGLLHAIRPWAIRAHCSGTFA